MIPKGISGSNAALLIGVHMGICHPRHPSLTASTPCSPYQGGRPSINKDCTLAITGICWVLLSHTLPTSPYPSPLLTTFHRGAETRKLYGGAQSAVTRKDESAVRGHGSEPKARSAVNLDPNSAVVRSRGHTNCPGNLGYRGVIQVKQC